VQPCLRPPALARRAEHHAAEPAGGEVRLARGVAVQAEFENPNFETRFSLHRLKG
jgi:hypothetical protein